MKTHRPYLLPLIFSLLLASTVRADPPDLRDVEQLESFVDGVMYTSMQNQHVAGAVVSVVADGEMLFAKGYGYSDLEQQVPVDPARTLFRIASISKLLTWTALMQLWEQGQLDLHTDINEYLDGIEIPATFDQPITVAHLMSHTPGLEDHVIKLFSRDQADMRPFLELLNEQLPRRMRPPGDLASYSNHGTALGALIVEQVSGVPWADYIETNVLRPLGMEFTSIRQPLPADLADHMSQGYRWQAGRYQLQPFEFVPLTPAGGASASASDMSRLLLAYLNDGQLDGVRILQPATAARMRESLYQSDPRLSSALHGFYESNRNGQRIFGHGGDTIWFHSEFMLMPQSNLGVFISTNTDTGGLLRRDFVQALLERFFPYQTIPPNDDFARTDPARVTGDYASLRSSFTDFTKIGRLISGVEIKLSEDKQLMLLGFGEPRYFEEVDSGLFRRIGYDQNIAFRFDSQGQASHMFFNQVPSASFERVGVLYSPTIQFGLLGFCGLVFLWVLIAWPVQRFSSRWNIPAGVSRYRGCGWLLALVFLLLNVCFAMAVSDPNEIVFGIPAMVRVLLLANLAIPVLSLALASQLPGLLREHNLGLTSRVFHLSVLLAGVAYTWFLYTWRLFSS
jgi:CubicO group peptidase (beta-lactamase class C family)